MLPTQKKRTKKKKENKERVLGGCAATYGDTKERRNHKNAQIVRRKKEKVKTSVPQAEPD